MCTIAHVWAPLTSAGTCGGKGEGAENARLAWAEIASGSLHSTFTVFWAKRATTWDFQQFFLYSYMGHRTTREREREKESQHRCATINPADTGLPVCRAPRRGLSRVVGVSRGGSRPARGATHSSLLHTRSERHTLGDSSHLCSRDVSAPRGSRHTRRAGRAFVDNIDETKH